MSDAIHFDKPTFLCDEGAWVRALDYAIRAEAPSTFRKRIVEWLPFFPDAAEQVKAMGDSWSAYQEFRLGLQAERAKSFAGEDWAKRFGTILGEAIRRDPGSCERDQGDADQPALSGPVGRCAGAHLRSRRMKPAFAAYSPDQHERQNLAFHVTRDGDHCHVELYARLNALNGPPLRDRLKIEIAEGAKWITLDMAQVDEIERGQFGELFSVARAVRGNLGAVTVLDARPEVIAGFRHWGVAQAFTFACSKSANSSETNV